MSNYEQLDRLLEGFVAGGVPGCALQIARRGETLYEGYFGYADLDRRTPVTDRSIFRQASMSKIPLYTTMMMLYERGEFLLTDPISNFFPEWRNPKKYVKTSNGALEAVPTEGPITVSDVLSMKCGLPYCNAPQETDNPTVLSMQKYMQPLWDRGHFTLREQIRAMAEVPLAFEPGTQWLYGFGSELAAGIIEAVCGKSVDDVFQEFLFDPLEMSDTRSHYFGDIRQRMVAFYRKTGTGKFEPAENLLDRRHLPGPENENGWARIFSNVGDFTKLMQMLANGGVYKGQRIMGRKTIDMMRANGLPGGFQDSYNAGYGYGYGVRTLIDREKGNHNGTPGAFGWTGGFGTWCEADPAEGVSIVYMHNMTPNEEQYYHLRVRTAAYGCLE